MPRPPQYFDDQPSGSAPMNPYEVTAGDLTPVPSSDAEVVRRHYIAHEASIKSIGTLNFLGALFLGFLTLIYAAMFVDEVTSADADSFAISALVLSIFTFCGGTLMGSTAWGLWRFKLWARGLATGLAVLGLFLFPIGTLVNAYFLYLLLSEKSNVIFSKRYQDIIGQTPHVKYHTSAVAWVALGMFILLLAVIVVMAALSGSRF